MGDCPLVCAQSWPCLSADPLVVDIVVAADVVKHNLGGFDSQDQHDAIGKGNAYRVKSFESAAQRMQPEVGLRWVVLKVSKDLADARA